MKQMPSAKDNDERLLTYLKEKYLQKDGTALIEIELYEGFELYDPLTRGKTRRLNQDIFELVERETNLIPTVTPLCICFHGRKLDETEQDEIRRMYKERYQNECFDKEWDQRTERGRFIRMLVFGIFMMTLYIIRSVNSDDTLFLEIISVLASFSLWEAADIWLVEEREIRKERFSFRQLRDARIEFN